MVVGAYIVPTIGDVGERISGLTQRIVSLYAMGVIEYGDTETAEMNIQRL
jgi:hypothetical protein